MNKITMTAGLVAWAILSGLAQPAQSQSVEEVPDELEGVGITEHLEAQIPLNLKFKDDEGRDVVLADYFEDGKPVLLNLVYYNCPMLCSLVINGAVDAIEETGWTPGDEFEMLTVSFDPLESHILANLKKQNYIKSLGIPGAESGWHFLTGEEDQIRALTDAVGFEYKWNEARQEWAHAAALFIITPDGRISRYLYGVMFNPTTFKLSMVEAADGGIGTAMDQILLYCFSYDAAAGSYAPIAINIMKLSGVVVLLFLGSLLGSLWLWERKRHKNKPSAAGESSK